MDAALEMVALRQALTRAPSSARRSARKASSRILALDAIEAERFAGQRLRDLAEIGGDHGRDDRIAAGGLVIGEQHDRRAASRHLHRARDDAAAQELTGSRRDRHAAEPHALTVARGFDGERRRRNARSRPSRSGPSAGRASPAPHRRTRSARSRGRILGTGVRIAERKRVAGAQRRAETQPVGTTRASQAAEASRSHRSPRDTRSASAHRRAP